MTTTYGTITTLPAGHSVRLVRRGASTPAELGQVARRQLRSSVSRQTGRRDTRVWSVTFGPDGLTELLASFDAGRGGALPLTWTPPLPDNTAIPVRFLDGTLRVSKAPGVYEAECELEEVI